MTRGLHFFLRDVFDTDDAALLERLTAKYSSDNGVLSVDAMLAQDPRVRHSLWFSELFKEVLGTYPCYQVVKRYLDANAVFDVASFCKYMHDTMPIVRMFSFNAPLLEKKLAFCRATDTKVLFACKLRHRYGLACVCDAPQPMVQTYRRCWKSTRDVVQRLVTALANNLRLPLLTVPEFTTSSVYFKFQERAISHFGLDRTNPFDLTRLPTYVQPRQPITLFDAMSQCGTEASVMLTLAGANVFYGSGTSRADSLNVLTLQPTPALPTASPFLVCHIEELLPYLPRIANAFVGLNTAPTPPLSRDVNRCLAFSVDPPQEYALSISSSNAGAPLWVDALRDKVSFGEAFDVLHWNSILACSPSVIYEEFLQRYFMQNRERILASFCPSAGAKNAVVVVDTRDNVLSIMSMLVTFSNLRQNHWSAVVVCESRNVPFYRQHLGQDVEFVHDFDLSRFSLDKYNALLKSDKFWRTFAARYERVLIIQDDGMLIRPGLEDAPYFDCDFVGAPWHPAYPGNDVMFVSTGGKMVGNGGLSLRKPSVMEKVCARHADQARILRMDLLQQEAEDTFFARLVPNPATTEMAAKFSSEEILNETSLGFHKLWMYHSHQKTEDFFNGVLEPQYRIRIAGRMGK